MNKQTLTAIIHKEGELYVAECSEIGTVSQGHPIEEAIGTLKGILRQARITVEEFLNFI